MHGEKFTNKKKTKEKSINLNLNFYNRIFNNWSPNIKKCLSNNKKNWSNSNSLKGIKKPEVPERKAKIAIKNVKRVKTVKEEILSFLWRWKEQKRKINSLCRRIKTKERRFRKKSKE